MFIISIEIKNELNIITTSKYYVLLEYLRELFPLKKNTFNLQYKFTIKDINTRIQGFNDKF